MRKNILAFGSPASGYNPVVESRVETLDDESSIDDIVADIGLASESLDLAHNTFCALESLGDEVDKASLCLLGVITNHLAQTTGGVIAKTTPALEAGHGFVSSMSLENLKDIVVKALKALWNAVKIASRKLVSFYQLYLGEQARNLARVRMLADRVRDLEGNATPNSFKDETIELNFPSTYSKVGFAEAKGYIGELVKVSEKTNIWSGVPEVLKELESFTIWELTPNTTDKHDIIAAKNKISDRLEKLYKDLTAGIMNVVEKDPATGAMVFKTPLLHKDQVFSMSVTKSESADGKSTEFNFSVFEPETLPDSIKNRTIETLTIKEMEDLLDSLSSELSNTVKRKELTALVGNVESRIDAIMQRVMSYIERTSAHAPEGSAGQSREALKTLRSELSSLTRNMVKFNRAVLKLFNSGVKLVSYYVEKCVEKYPKPTTD